MKKLLLFQAALMLLFIVNGYSQVTFSTGAMDVYIGQYGKLRLFTPDGTKHMQLGALLVGTSPTSVFDHENDAEVVDPTTLVANPAKSDFEIYGAYDNAYSGDPPNVLLKLNAFGWNNAAYTIIRYNVKNRETSTINAMMGLEVLPIIQGSYGFDTVTYLSTEGVIQYHRGTGTNMGIKLLSAPLTSLYSFEWYDGYQVDTSFWNWMNYGAVQPQYVSNTVEGPVSITSQTAIPMATGDEVNVYYAFALGADKAAMLANIAEAVVKYQGLITGVDDGKPVSAGFDLGQNYPNPVKNSTSISYQIPDDGLVTLKVYNVVGSEVATLVNADQQKGPHTVSFNVNTMAGGVYFYKLTFDGQVRTNKMFVVK